LQAIFSAINGIGVYADSMLDAVNNSRKQRGRPFKPGTSGNMRGRPKRSRNKHTRAVIEAANAGGETPFDYMLRVMRDGAASAKRRDEMAKSAAPYLHAKLAPIERLEPPDDGEGKPPDNLIEIELVRPPSETRTGIRYDGVLVRLRELSPPL
jgi:hypothetical protein